MKGIGIRILPGLLLLSAAAFADEGVCSHQDASWEHRVDENGDLDVAVKPISEQVTIYLGGRPGGLQIIKLAGLGDNIGGTENPDDPDAKDVMVTLLGGSAERVTHRVDSQGLYRAEQHGGQLLILVPNLLHLVLKNKQLTIRLPTKDGKRVEYQVNVADIPLGLGHTCQDGR